MTFSASVSKLTIFAEENLLGEAAANEFHSSLLIEAAQKFFHRADFFYTKLPSAMARS